MARPSCFRLLVQEARRAASRADWTAGRSRAIKTAMIAMTTSNSIRVKPRDRLRREGNRIMEQTPEGNEPRTVAGTFVLPSDLPASRVGFCCGLHGSLRLWG